jgi:hypothetical protein
MKESNKHAGMDAAGITITVNSDKVAPSLISLGLLGTPGSVIVCWLRMEELG